MEPGISLYPNPAFDHVVIKADESLLPMVISVYNSIGEKINEFSMEGMHENLPIGEFSPGIYHFHFSSRSKGIVEKVIIQH